MHKPLLPLVILLAATLPAHAAVGVASSAFVYNQSFDSLTTSATATAWANDSTLAGWSLFISTGAAAPTIAADTGGSNTGTFRSFGASGSGDRALGGTGSGGTYFGSPAAGAVAGWIAAAFTNTSADSFGGFAVGFNGEQWRNGGNTSAHSMELQYGFGNSFGTVADWTAPGGNFTWTSPVIGATSAAVDGNSAGLVGGLGGNVTTPWTPGQTLWVRWREDNNLGGDHGLAIDNFSLSVTAVPEPESYALLLAGLVAVGGMVRRHRRAVAPPSRG